MTYANAIENRDIKRIDKLNSITKAADVFPTVRKWTKNASDHAGHRWQVLAEARYNELKQD